LNWLWAFLFSVSFTKSFTKRIVKLFWRGWEKVSLKGKVKKKSLRK